MKVTHIQLSNWFNFKSVDVDIGDRLFVFGANASGKSNFLDAFRFLRDLAADGGGLQSAVKARGGFGAIRSLHATGRGQEVSLAIRCVEEDGVDEDQQKDTKRIEWEYRLVLEVADDRVSALVKAETVTRSDQDSPVLQRPDPSDQKDPLRKTQTHLEQVNSNQAFRAIAELFRSVRYLHLVPQLLREPDRYVRVIEDPFGADFLGRIAQTPKKSRDARLKRISMALALALPQFEELRFIQDEKGRPHLEARYKHWRKRGAWQKEHQFSDGTIRLIGLLWEVTAPGGPLLLEEPELSLHSAIVRQLPRVFARALTRHGRQVFLSTHSEDIFADKGIAPREVLVLEATKNETVAIPASTIEEVEAMARARESFGDILVARTRPRGVEELSLFGG